MALAFIPSSTQIRNFGQTLSEGVLSKFPLGYAWSILRVLGTTTTINAPLPIDSIGLGYQTTLGSVFTDDFTDNNGSASVVTIS